LLNTNRHNNQIDTGCGKSCSASCPPTTCMSGLALSLDNFSVTRGDGLKLVIVSLRSGYQSLTTDLFHPPRK